MSALPLILLMVFLTIVNLYVVITEYNEEKYKSALVSAFVSGVTFTTAVAISIYM